MEKPPEEKGNTSLGETQLPKHGNRMNSETPVRLQVSKGVSRRCTKPGKVWEWCLAAYIETLLFKERNSRD